MIVVLFAIFVHCGIERYVVVVISLFVSKGFVVLEVVLKVALRNRPNPAIKMIAMTMRAEIPREIARLSLVITQTLTRNNSQLFETMS